MPLTSDEATLKLSQAIIDQLQAVFGKHAGSRPAHAKGTIVTGTFTPSPEAGKLSIAPHFNGSVPVWARFSNSTGIPNIPDTDPNAAPKGVGLRFHLGERKHTDIIAHSTPHFPVNNGEDFLKLFQAIGTSGPDTPHPTPIEQFLGTHPAALRFVTDPKPAPVSYGTLSYFGLHAFNLIDSSGNATAVRWYLTPAAGAEYLSEAQIAGADPNLHQDELVERLGKGPIVFKLEAQIAEKDDVTNDVTVEWPADRETVVLGEVKLEKVLEDSAEASKHVIFDPVPRVAGIKPSEDPLIDFRAQVYLLSGRARRSA